MRIWLITIGEPLQISDPNDRLQRTGILAKSLVKRGHQVIWWTSTFDHVRKKHRFYKDTNYKLSDNFEIKLLHAIQYKKNISIIKSLL